MRVAAISCALAVAAALSVPLAAEADSVDSRCDIHPKGEDRATASLACTFSQFQGNVYIDRSDGVSYAFVPAGDQPGNYVDESGAAVYRNRGLGDDGLIFRTTRESVYVYWDASSLDGGGGGDSLVPAAGGQDQDVYGQPDAPLVAEVLGTRVRTTDPEEMKYVILGALTDKYAAGDQIQVEQEEIDAYVETMNRAKEQDHRKRKDRREEIERQLASGSLDDEQRKALTSELDMLNELLASLGGGSDSDEELREERAAREQVASAFILQWKINQALYRQYGGRVIFQQGGPEPLDAYRQFLEEAQKRGDFRILDASLEPGFWRYYKTDSIHSFYPEGSDEEAQAFETPWWLTGDTGEAR